MTTNNNRYFAIIFYAGGLALMLAVTLLLLSGCNAEKRAVKKEARKSNKALKHIQKAERVQPNELAKWCAKRYNPTDSVHETVVYKPGITVRDTIFDTDVVVLNDTVYLTKTKTVTVRVVDTMDYSKFRQAANRAALDSMDAHYKRILAAKDKELAKKDDEIKKLNETILEKDKDIAKLRERIRIALIALAILSIYTLGRWILRIWGVKLP